MNQPNPKIRLRPVIRVFVSSTFSDMKHERNAIQEHVFPKLEELCQKNCFQFQAIDLRWGVSSEAGLDHRTMRICFDELRRAQEISPKPNFLILLGNRYGWRPLPEEIFVEEFEALERIARAESAEHAEVLQSWYRRDDNAAPPVHILQSRIPHLPDWKGCPENAAWSQIQIILWEIINRAMPPDQLRGRFDEARLAADPLPGIVRFQASATEQEIWQGALRVPDAQEHVLAFIREIADIATVKDPALIKDFVDVQSSGGLDTVLRDEQARLKKHLRERLGEANVFEALSVKLNTDVTTDHLSKLCSDVETRMTQIIQSQMDAYWQQTKPGAAERGKRELEIEQQEHARFGQERGGAGSFVGRAEKLAAIHDYLLSDSTSPLVIHGASGCGKTALMARAAERQRSEVGDQNSKVITRFIGTTPRASDLRGLLTSLCQELRLRGPREGELPTDIKLLELELQEQFKLTTPGQPLILFLDALDQLVDTDGGRNLHWIPVGPLSADVKLVVSCLSDREDDPAGQPYAELLRRQLPATQFINLDAFSENEARTLLFERWLPQAGRTVGGDHRARIVQRMAVPACRQPIYLKLLFEEARLWRSFDSAPDLGGNVPALLTQLFERLSQKTNHGPLLVERVLGYLAASREGLADNEILEILFQDREYKDSLLLSSQKTQHEMPPNATRIPIAIWSRLRFDLAAYLTERAATGANVLTFYHRQVAEWVRERFEKSPHQCWQPHAFLADYFRDLADPAKNQSWKGERPRPLLQVVFHQVGADRVNEYCQTLCDLRFVEARCRVGQVYELVADYRLARESLPEAKADLERQKGIETESMRWTRELIAYAKAWSNRRDQISAAGTWHPLASDKSSSPIDPAVPASAAGAAHLLPFPEPPTPPPVCRMWTEADIKEECDRILEKPERRDRLEAFAAFVKAQCYLLQEHGFRPGYVLQQAFNAGSAGPVHVAAAILLPTLCGTVVLRRWPANTPYNAKPALLQTLETHEGVSSVSVTPDGRRAVSGSLDKTLRVWDLESGACLRKLEGHSDGVWSVSVTPDGRRAVSGSGDHTVRVWDLDSGACLRTLVGHSDHILSVSVTPDGRRAVSGSWDKTLRVWDLGSGACLQKLEDHSEIFLSVSVTPDGRKAVTGGLDNTARVWDLENGACLRKLKAHNDGVWSVSVTPDGRRAVSGSGDNTVRVWDLDSGACLRTLAGHNSQILSVSVTPDGRRVVTGSEDSTIQVWDVENGSCLRTFEVVRGWRGPVADMTANGVRVVSASGFSNLAVWDLEKGQHLRVTDEKTKSMSLATVAPDDQRAVSRSDDNTVRLWDLESGACLRALAGHSGQVLSVKVTPDGGRAVSGSEDHTVRVWDLQSGACLRKLEGHSDAVGIVSVTPNGRRVVSGSWDKTLRVWDLESGACLRKLEGHSHRPLSVSVTPEGRRVVSGSWDKTLRVWDLQSGACLRKMEGHSDAVLSLSVTPDGRRVVSGSEDHTVRVWDLESGACLRKMEDHSDAVRSVSVTPDGRRIVAISNNELCVHDIETGSCLDSHRRGPRDEYLKYASVTRDGSRLITIGFWDGIICFDRMRFWDLTNGLKMVAEFSYPFINSTRMIHCGGLRGGGVLMCGEENGLGRFFEVRDTCCDQGQPLFHGVEPGPNPKPDTLPNPSDEGYEHLLRRGIDFSLHEKGPDHEETLAHIVALAMHLENAGESEEAKEVRRAHDEHARRKEDKTTGS